MGEKLFQARAKIVKTLFAVGCPGKPVLWTPAIARLQDLAIPAVLGQSVPLLASEFALRRVLQYFHERCFENVPDAVLRIDKMIAGVEISVMLDDHDIAAGLLENAQSMLHPEQGSERLIEVLDGDPADIVPEPLVENRAQELSVGFCRRRLRAYPAPALPRDQRKELQELHAELLEKAINRSRLPDVPTMHDAQHVAWNPVALQEPDGLDHPLVGRTAALGHAIAVVERLRSVDADADLEAFRGEEAAPFVVDQRAVGLNAIEDLPSRRSVLALELDDSAEIIEP